MLHIKSTLWASINNTNSLFTNTHLFLEKKIQSTKLGHFNLFSFGTSNTSLIRILISKLCSRGPESPFTIFLPVAIHFWGMLRFVPSSSYSTEGFYLFKVISIQLMIDLKKVYLIIWHWWQIWHLMPMSSYNSFPNCISVCCPLCCISSERKRTTLTVLQNYLNVDAFSEHRVFNSLFSLFPFIWLSIIQTQSSISRYVVNQ